MRRRSQNFRLGYVFIVIVHSINEKAKESANAMQRTVSGIRDGTDHAVQGFGGSKSHVAPAFERSKSRGKGQEKNQLGIDGARGISIENMEMAAGKWVWHDEFVRKLFKQHVTVTRCKCSNHSPNFLHEYQHSIAAIITTKREYLMILKRLMRGIIRKYIGLPFL